MHPKTCQKATKRDVSQNLTPETNENQNARTHATSTNESEERKREPHRPPRTKVKRQKPERTGAGKDNVQEATKQVPPKGVGNIQN